MAGELITEEFKKDLYLLLSNTYLTFLEDESPVQTGNLKRSWYLTEIEPLVYLIHNDAEYAKFLEEGTGIYGPKKKPITPKTKKALAFKIGGNQIIVKSVKGIKPIQLIAKAASSTKIKKDFDAGMQKLFEKHFFANIDF